MKVTINEKTVSMEVDTGASVSIISEDTYNSVFAESKPLLHKNTDVVLRTYTGQKIPVVGCCTVAVKHNNQTAQLPLLIVSGQGPNLLGRDWLREPTASMAHN